MKIPKVLSMVGSLSLVASLTACGASTPTKAAAPKHYTVYAFDSCQHTINVSENIFHYMPCQIIASRLRDPAMSRSRRPCYWGLLFLFLEIIHPLCRITAKGRN